MTTQLATQLALAADERRQRLSEIEKICAWLLGQPHGAVVVSGYQGVSFVKHHKGWRPTRNGKAEAKGSLELAMCLVQAGTQIAETIKHRARKPGLAGVETTCVQLVRVK